MWFGGLGTRSSSKKEKDIVKVGGGSLETRERSKRIGGGCEVLLQAQGKGGDRGGPRVYQEGGEELTKTPRGKEEDDVKQRVKKQSPGEKGERA